MTWNYYCTALNYINNIQININKYNGSTWVRTSWCGFTPKGCPNIDTNLSSTHFGGSPGATGLSELLVSPIMRSYSTGLLKATRSPASDLGTTRSSRAPVCCTMVPRLVPNIMRSLLVSIRIIMLKNNAPKCETFTLTFWKMWDFYPHILPSRVPNDTLTCAPFTI